MASEGTEQTAGGDLQQRTFFMEPDGLEWVADDARIPLRVCDDRYESIGKQFKEAGLN